MKAISIRQPWAYAIIHAGKRHENRSWRTNFRGEVLLHASKWFRPEEVRDDVREVEQMAIRSGVALDGPITLRVLQAETGGIVGVARVVDCVSESTSPWFFGPYALVLDDVRPLPFIPCGGALGFWAVPDGIARAVEGILKGVCACESELDDPGPTHLPSCAFADPGHEVTPW